MTFWRKKPIIAVDLDDVSIRTAAVTKNSKGLDCRVSAFSTPGTGGVETGDAAALAEALKAAAEQAGFAGGKVISAVGGEKVILRQLTIPKMPEREIAAALRWEAERLIVTSLEELELRHIVLGETVVDDIPQYAVLLAAVPKETVYRYYEIFSRANLKLTALDLPALALWRVFANEYASYQGLPNKAAVYIGFSASYLIVVKERQLRYVRTLSVGINNILESIGVQPTSHTVIADAAAAADYAVREQIFYSGGMQDIITDIKRSLDFYHLQNKDEQVENLVLTGCLNELPGITTLFEQELAMNAVTGQALDHPAEFSVAIGLALREVLK